MIGVLVYTLVSFVAYVIIIGVPCFAIYAVYRSGWNQRRLNRARRYRARHGTPWWVWESDPAQRQRKWIERERDRVDGMA